MKIGGSRGFYSVGGSCAARARLIGNGPRERGTLPFRQLGAGR